jgi:hypothetical protein
MALPPNSTLQDVLDSLDRPKHYVTGMLKRLEECASIYDNSEIVIGITGNGNRPYYQIRYMKEGELIIYNAFFDNHVSFSKEQLGTEIGVNWSSRALSLEDVRNINRKVPRPAGSW